MRYLSVCSGIEAASVAWHHLGWTPVAFSEIEPFPAAVLKHRFPHVPNYGDMTRHAEWPLGPGSIDLLVGGTPCQSFSVAGLRKGLRDPRGGLMLTYLEIAQRLRPRWIVWENVPGVLSSGGGRDFGSFLGALVELGYGVAYRVLDAQWVRTQRHPRAVPQRRRRVFVVGCLGDWERAAAVLFERESVQRDSAPRRAQGEGASADAEGCVATVSSKWAKATRGPAGDECYNLTTQPIAGTIGNRGLRSHTELDGHGAYIPVAVDVADALVAKNNQTTGFQTEVCAQPVVSIQGAATRINPTSGPDGIGVSQLGVAYTLEARSEVQAVAQPVPFTKAKRAQSTTDDETWVDGKVNPTISLFDQGDTRATTVAVAFNDTSATLKGGSGERGYPDPSDGNGHGIVGSAMTVRRLTPRECERLQGFPDDWTLIPWRGKPAEQCPDGPRYKALGNSMAVNCMAWIGERIAASEAQHAAT